MTLAMLMILLGAALVYAGIRGKSLIALVTLRGSEPSVKPEPAR